MRRTLHILLALLIFCSILLSCGKASDSNIITASEVAIEPILVTPELTSEPSPEAEIEINGKAVKISQLELGYSFDLFGKEVNTLTTERLEYSLVSIGDEGLDIFRQILPYMKALNYLSFDRCETSDEAVATLRDEFSSIRIAWRIFQAFFMHDRCRKNLGITRFERREY